ncbi:MAG: SufS family cysteine desulfurase [Terrimicrobiaceae bacterium]|nr:SufS family cysteine desulfurase [Terrimicrobiaceae bacterium]
MSIPRLDSAETPVAGGDALHTALIKQLTGEFFSGSTRAEQPFSTFPAVHPEAGVPGAVPASLDTPGAAPQMPDAVAPAQEPPPVHPPSVADSPGKRPASPPPSGGHSPDSADAFPFGEPRNQSLLSSNRSTEPSVAGDARDQNSREAVAPARYEVVAEPDFYFLRAPHSAPAVSAPAPRSSPPPISAFDVDAVRRDFPALDQEVNGRPLVYLDNAATTQKPQAVIDATSHFYSRDNANIHRAAYELAERATAAFENAREKVRQFLGAGDKSEVVFLRGTTEAINLVAQSYGKKHIEAGDEILLTELEHHANIVPWQLLAEQVGAVIRVVPINDRGELILDEYVKLLGPRTKIVSVAHVSNALGTLNPVETIIQLAHAHGVPVLVDGAQSTPHLPVNVQALDVDFFVFSGHKVFGPTGIGALYGKPHLLEAMPPWQGGGHMIQDVRFEKTTFRHAPEKFEAGTPDIAGAVGLGAAIDYLFQVGIPSIAAYEHALLEYATTALATVPGLRPIGTAASKASVLSFIIPGQSNDHIAHHLDKQGIAVRAGHHCALPAHRHFGLESTVRPSLAFYNTREDVDALVRALHLLPRP